jgi:HK97 family phage major capsid protein
MSDYIARQVELRAKAWEEAKHLLDTAANEARDLTAEENEQYDRITEDMENRARVIEQIKADEERAARLDAAAAAAEIRTDIPVAENTDDTDAIRRLAAGEIRSFNFEKRDVLTTSTGAPVPTSFYDQVILRARLTGPMLDPNVVTILNTAGGETLQVPSLATYSAGTLFSQGGTIGESDPTFNSFVELKAYKYGFLVQLSREMIEDSGVDILSFLADQVGNGLGYSVQAQLTTGDGSNKPKGIAAAAGSGVTGGTGVSGAFTADNLIDLYYSLDGAARLLPGLGWMMNGASIGAVRKLKDNSGQYVFQPSLSMDSPDMLLGKPVYENPHLVDQGVNAKSVIVGHLPSYFVRQVGGIRLDRSDDFAFNTDLVTFRATIRVDGNLPQSSHIKYFAGGTA